ncbi:hypothetical protein HYH02_011295 [Chlamydomonas schloesseri]|uniref:Uncharacterized protein n=1 Tax=Chlamydomonas schloesseri TaxID=2026947 RepID=A0A835T148_9CHLO|nr:hypothetical protein HYH02_011295 [Chlamydomonas schloesseri]|eukprot:KAG2437032.1 hypothetical protein HYH02_011295 [Chlamydomonas schloesseri]
MKNGRSYLHYRMSGPYPPEFRDRLPELLRDSEACDDAHEREADSWKTLMHLMVRGCLTRRFFPDPPASAYQPANGGGSTSRGDVERAEYLTGAMHAMLQAGFDPHAPDAQGTTVVQLLTQGRRQYSQEAAELAGTGRVGAIRALLNMLSAINGALAACGHTSAAAPAADASTAAGPSTPAAAAGKRRIQTQQESPVGVAAAAAGAAAAEAMTPAAAAGSRADAAAAPDAPRKRARSTSGEAAASTCGPPVKQEHGRGAVAVKLEDAAGAATEAVAGGTAGGPATARIAIKPEPGTPGAAVGGTCGPAAWATPATAAAVKQEAPSVMGSAAWGATATAVKQEPLVTPAASACSGAARTAAAPGRPPQPQWEPEQETVVGTDQEQPVPVMPFGQHAGRPLTHLPASYVCWMCQQQGFFSGSTQRQELCLQMLDLDLIQPAAPGAVSPVTEHEYDSGYQPVWRVAPATPEEKAAAEAATMEWGKHEGDLLSELPSDYIGWMCNIAEGFWDLDQARKRKLLRHLEVLGRVRYTEEGRVVRAGGERSARRHGFGSYFGYEAACRGAPCGGWCADYSDDEF